MKSKIFLHERVKAITILLLLFSAINLYWTGVIHYKYFYRVYFTDKGDNNTGNF